MHLNAIRYLGIGLGEFNIFIALCNLMYSLQPLNERDMTGHLVRRDIKGILITRWIRVALTWNHQSIPSSA